MLAPNGSSIFIYGYNNGLRIVWRGGKSFLASPRRKSVHGGGQTESATKIPNNDDSIMIIDSDEEEPAQATPSDQGKVEYEIFEDEEVEIEPSRPYEPILRYVDISLGTKALKLAVPSVLPEKARSHNYVVPPILNTSMVLSVVGADSKLRVISLPLSPPHPSTKTADLAIHTLTFDATVSHNEIPEGVSMTFASDLASQNVDSGLRRSQQPSTDETNIRWNLLVATHATEASGTLLIYHIPVVRGAKDVYTISSKDTSPPERHFLPAPAKTIKFNPSPYPAARHTHLLVSFACGYVKILTCAPALNANKDASSGSVRSTGGQWLLTLYPGFEQQADARGRRKTIVDAAWVLSGRAVMVLLSDGEWGVWDVEGAGPGSEPGPLVGQASSHGVTGGSLTAYAISGRIFSGTKGTNNVSTTSKEGVSEQRGKFAPMTPSSRRVREDTLFKGGQPLAASSSQGQICVSQTSSSRAVFAEESILIRHGDQIATIPSLLSLWRSSVKTTGTFDASHRCRVSPLVGINLYGERLTGLTHVLLPPRADINEDEQQEYELLITAEHRLIVLSRDLTPNPPAAAPMEAANEPETTDTNLEKDQFMLNQGQLDVDGMSRVLTSMSGVLPPAVQSNGFRSPIKRARVFS